MAEPVVNNTSTCNSAFDSTAAFSLCSFSLEYVQCRDMPVADS